MKYANQVNAAHLGLVRIRKHLPECDEMSAVYVAQDNDDQVTLGTAW